MSPGLCHSVRYLIGLLLSYQRPALHGWIKLKKKLLDLFAQAIRARLGYRVRRILLFGSRAKGDNAPDSDYDCLVILDDISSEAKAAIDEIAGEFLCQYDVVFSILPKKEKEL